MYLEHNPLSWDMPGMLWAPLVWQMLQMTTLPHYPKKKKSHLLQHGHKELQTSILISRIRDLGIYLLQRWQKHICYFVHLSFISHSLSIHHVPCWKLSMQRVKIWKNMGLACQEQSSVESRSEAKEQDLACSERGWEETQKSSHELVLFLKKEYKWDAD